VENLGQKCGSRESEATESVEGVPLVGLFGPGLPYIKHTPLSVNRFRIPTYMYMYIYMLLHFLASGIEERMLEVYKLKSIWLNGDCMLAKETYPPLYKAADHCRDRACYL
jgi:hypothetical protein